MRWLITAVALVLVASAAAACINDREVTRDRQIAGEDAIHFRRWWRKEFGHLEKCFQCEIHRLELRGAGSDSRAEGKKSQMFVQP